jgi:uncharacterized phage protein (TIGR01671 family)
MNREIKFRAWDRETSTMWQVEGIKFDHLGMGYEVMPPPDSEDIEWLSEEEVSVMQFTGLKDKNGREIYEGDLFPCIYTRDGCTHTSEVVYQGYAFQLKRHGECQQPSVYQSLSDMTRSEGIGNIYENPELLKTN